MLRRLLTDRKLHCATEQYFRLWSIADLEEAAAEVPSSPKADMAAQSAGFSFREWRGRRPGWLETRFDQESMEPGQLAKGNSWLSPPFQNCGLTR
jgi:hypothetical protein